MSKIKNILFDLGGVIMTIDQPEAVRRFKAAGLADAEQRLDPYTQKGIFGDLEEGLITAEDFRQELSRMVGRELTYDECQHCWLGYRKEIPARNVRVLDRLRADGYRLILLSNTNPFMMKWAMSADFSGDGRSIASFFDTMFRSYEMKMMKPDGRIFRKILSDTGIKAEETLFVDDGEKNTSVAARLGFKTFCPDNGSDWTEEIYKVINNLSTSK